MSKADTSSETVYNNDAFESGPLDDGKLTDANIVDWDGENDAANPLNWPNGRRWAHAIMVSILALVT